VFYSQYLGPRKLRDLRINRKQKKPFFEAYAGIAVLI
jgi:hypothetical protein